MSLALCFSSKTSLIENNWKQPSTLRRVNSSNRTLLKSALVALLGSAVAVTEGFAFAEVARGALTLETQASLTYDSYFIGATTVGDDDYYATLRPTLRWVRRAGIAELSASAGVAVIRYDTYDRFDSEDLQAAFRAELPFVDGSRMSGFFDVSYSESTVVDYDVMDRVPTESIRASLLLDYQLGVKTSLTERFSYQKSDRSLYSDQEILTNNLSFVYSDFLHGTSLRLGHEFIRTTSSGINLLNADLDQTSHSVYSSLSRPLYGPLRGEVTYGYRVLDRSAQENFIGQTESKGGYFGVTLSGPFLPPSRFPKVQSSASLSYREAPSLGINDTGQRTLTGDARLAWQARERTSISLAAGRTVDLTANDLSVENTRVSASVEENIGIATTVNASLSYNWRKYRGFDRDDRTLNATLSANYQLTRYWSAGASYMYQDNESEGRDIIVTQNPFYRARPASYERHVVSVYVRNVF